MRSALMRRARCLNSQAPITRHLNISTSRQTARHASTSASDPQNGGSQPAEDPNAKSRTKRRSRAIPLLSLGAVGAACYAFYSSSAPSDSGGGGVLNDVTFVPYTITSKEFISPTSFILTVRPRRRPLSLPYLEPGGAAWKFAQWSVEFKQPEAQIARHYTPLPPEDGDDGADGSDGALRFYIRAVGGGEMSAYIGRLRVGADVWLRGPHAGFDVRARLGAKRDVVFLAGGTGIAPGVQVARAVLDGAPAARVRLLWAVRHRSELQEARGGGEGMSWRMPWSRREPDELDVGGMMRGVARQLADMKRRYGERLSVQVAVDEEGVRFSEAHLRRVLGREEDAGAAGQGAEGCELHDARALEGACEYENPGALRCGCAGGEKAKGKNLLIVSGPEGFVEHFAGGKVWRNGVQTQGPVGGMVGKLGTRDPALARDWLVLKL